ncbi:DeoR family transcriptional regulator [Peribacillus butanolivorans]|uniref:DeoR family transcriptional regulator n=1 Tax=Peribacillus butanolivorans TaxID=421767 RepID=UPI0036D85D2C
MLPQDRQSEIMKQLHEFKTVKILELSRELNVTRETIRKDLYELEEKGLFAKSMGRNSKQSNLETSYINR